MGFYQFIHCIVGFFFINPSAISLLDFLNVGGSLIDPIAVPGQHEVTRVSRQCSTSHFCRASQIHTAFAPQWAFQHCLMKNTWDLFQYKYCWNDLWGAEAVCECVKLGQKWPVEHCQLIHNFRWPHAILEEQMNLLKTLQQPRNLWTN